MNPDYTKNYEAPLDKRFRFPVESYHHVQELSEAAIKLRMRKQHEYESVKKDLDTLGRSPIQVTPGINSPFNAICVQVFTPGNFNGSMLRHQAVLYMAEFAFFFEPIMATYLKEHKIGYTTYLEKMFTGEIWCDEFILGAIAKMWNIKITIVSPFFSPPWDLFHKGDEPHVILVTNGGDFGKVRGVTHFSATKGKGSTWRCVQPETRMGEVVKYSGRAAGSSTAIACNAATAKRIAVEKATAISTEFDDICAAMKALSIRKDKLIEEMSQLKMDVDHIKKSQRYQIEDYEHVKPKLAAVRRITEDAKVSRISSEPKSQKSQQISFTQAEMENLMDEFARSPAAKVHGKQQLESESSSVKLKHTKKDSSKKVEKKLQAKISNYITDKIQVDSDTDESERRKNEKDTADKEIWKIVRKIKQNDEQHPITVNLNKQKKSESKDERLPSLGEYAEVISSQSTDLEPGVIKVTSIGLPHEARDDRRDEIEDLAEYSGNFQLSDSQREQTDQYLLQQEVITQQPAQSGLGLPRYEDIDPNAPGDTQVEYHGAPYDKSVVDLFRRLQPKEQVQLTEMHQEHDYAVKQPNLQSNDLQTVRPEELDIYLDRGKSPKRPHLDTPQVHRLQKKTLPKKHKCKFCAGKFTNVTYKNHHEQFVCDKNPDKKKIKCECGSSYAHYSNYRDHRSAVHSETPRHFCKICGTTFPHQNGLARHKIRDH